MDYGRHVCDRRHCDVLVHHLIASTARATWSDSQDFTNVGACSICFSRPAVVRGLRLPRLTARERAPRDLPRTAPQAIT
jgi:hypothetical protein